MDVTVIPVDTLSGMDEQDRLNYLRDRIYFTEGDIFKKYVKDWPSTNSLNTSSFGSTEYCQYSKLQMSNMLPYVKDEIMDKDSIIGSRLHSFFETEAFRKWYPMGMNLDMTNTKIFGCGDMLK